MKQLFLLGLVAAACGAQAATIYNNGPVVNASGLSVLTTPATTFGFGAQTGSNNAVADDFIAAHPSSPLLARVRSVCTERTNSQTDASTSSMSVPDGGR